MKKQMTEPGMDVTNESYDAIFRRKGESVWNVIRVFHYAVVCILLSIKLLFSLAWFLIRGNSAI